jgi:hypothetical protein
MGTTATAQPVVLDQGRSPRRALSADTHHTRLGSGRALPYSANRGKQSVNRMALDELKQQIPLLEYLQAHDWQQARPIGFGRFLGLCPLHADHKPSFLVDPNKNLFDCYGYRRGGDVIRFAELYSPGEVPASCGVAAPMARIAAAIARSCRFLSHAVTPSRGCVPTCTNAESARRN